MAGRDCRSPCGHDPADRAHKRRGGSGRTIKACLSPRHGSALTPWRRRCPGVLRARDRSTAPRRFAVPLDRGVGRPLLESRARGERRALLKFLDKLAVGSTYSLGEVLETLLGSGEIIITAPVGIPSFSSLVIAPANWRLRKRNDLFLNSRH